MDLIGVPENCHLGTHDFEHDLFQFEEPVNGLSGNTNLQDIWISSNWHQNVFEVRQAKQRISHNSHSDSSSCSFRFNVTNWS